MLSGVGTDLASISRIGKVIDRHGDRFLKRVFTDHEIETSQTRGLGATEALAARWAAKEAVAKALGIGIRAGINFKDIEVVNDKQGKPNIRLHGMVKHFAANNHITKMHISLTHENDLAMAFVVAEHVRPRR